MGIRNEVDMLRADITHEILQRKVGEEYLEDKINAIHKTVDCATCGCMIKQEKAEVIRNVEWYRMVDALVGIYGESIQCRKDCDKDDPEAKSDITESYYCGKCYPAAKRKDKQAL